MNKRISLGVAISLVLIAVAVTFSAATLFSMKLFDSKVSSASERASLYDKLNEIDKVVRSNYYGEIDDTALFSSTAEGFIAGLGDPDSVYLTAEQIAARDAEMDGTAIGFGIGVERNASGYMVINRVVPGSSADKIGLIVGDVITKIDGQDVLVIGYDSAREMLSGPEGSRSEIVYNREGAETAAELTRSTTESTSVTYTQLGDIAYVRVDKMNNTTAAQFERAVYEASANEDSAGIVIDLRDTSGGYDLSVAADMLDVMLPAGDTVKGMYKGGEIKTIYTSDERGVSANAAVLVNDKTYGFAELFAAVMKERDRCEVVGTPTAGHGTLQQLIKLSDGTGVDVTVAELLTASETSYNVTGVQPDYVIQPVEGFILVTQPDEAADAQYKRACDLLRAA